MSLWTILCLKKDAFSLLHGEFNDTAVFDSDVLLLLRPDLAARFGVERDTRDTHAGLA